METPATGGARPAARLIVLSGPSGIGLHSVVELVRARSPGVWLPVPVTTRPRRAGEVDGVARHFVDRARFAELIEAGELLEWTQLGEHRYGTPRSPVAARLHEGRPVLLKIDPAGAAQVRRAMPGARLVLLAAPTAPAYARGDAATGPERDVAEFDVTVTADSVVRAADELVGLLGSPALL